MADADLPPPDLTAGAPDLLSAPEVGIRVVRGGAVRLVGYGVGMLFTAGSSVLLLRHLGVADFGRYMTVASLIAVVGGVTDAGLTAVGGRDLAQRATPESRARLLGALMGLRLLVTPAGALVAIAFALAAGYQRTLVFGAALAGVGLVLTTVQATIALPLSVDLRIAALTTLEVIRPAAQLAGIALLVAVGAGLLPFFVLFVVVAVVALAATPVVIGSTTVWRPRFDREAWRVLAREALPVAATIVMGVFYFRLLILLMSLTASAVATGLFATSFRIIEILYGISWLIATTAFPVLAATANDRFRFRYILQRLVEVGAIAALYLVVVIAILAVPILDVLGGSAYRGAAPVLRIQAFALIPVFAATACQLALVAIRRQRALALASGCALMIVLASGLILIPPYGAKGAAVAAVASEAVFAIVNAVLLARADPSLLPSVVFFWKPALAAAFAGAVGLGADLWAPVAAVVATLTFAATLVITRGVPPELSAALAPHRRS
jgi:O-antigen/teichoic acid export membrane protein